MKPTLTYTMIGLALGAGLMPLTAAPESAKAAKISDKTPVGNPFEVDPNVRVQLEYIEMPLLTMAELMDDEKATDTDTALRARVAELIKKGNAKLVDMHMLTVPDGQKATSESIREFIYPTEYEPPEIPNEIHLHAPGGTQGKMTSKDFATGPTPTAFETRNLGTTLEIEASVTPNGRSISLRFAPETVYFVEFTTYTDWKDKHGRSDIVMPVMYSMRITSALTVADGKPALVASLSPKDAKGVTDPSRKVLVFIKADILPVK